MNISIIATSPRHNSNTLRFAKYLKNLLEAQDSNQVSLVDFSGFDFPNVGIALDKNNLTTFQAALISNWEAADLVIMAIPEYNWLPNAELINAVNHLGGRDFMHLFHNKTFALAGTSAGRGGRQPALEMTMMLNKVVSFGNQFSVVSPKIFEAHEIPKNVDADGQSLGNEVFEKGTQAFLDYSIMVAQRWQTA